MAQTNLYNNEWLSLVAQMVKNLPTMQETQVWSLGWEEPLEKGIATHSSIVAASLLQEMLFFLLLEHHHLSPFCFWDEASKDNANSRIYNARFTLARNHMPDRGFDLQRPTLDWHLWAPNLLGSISDSFANVSLYSLILCYDCIDDPNKITCSQ